MIKQKTVKQEKDIGVFGKCKRAISNFFYGISVSIHNALPKRRTAKTLKHANIGKNVFYWVMFALPILQFVIFYLAVNFNSVLMAFQSITRVGPGNFETEFVGFETIKSFIELHLKSTVYSTAIKNSLIYFAISVIVVIPLGLIFSFYVYKKYPLSKTFRVFLFLPSVICGLILVIFYSYIVDLAIPELFGLKEGLFTTSKTAFPTLIVFNILFSFGPSSLIYVNAMTQIDPSVMESAEMDGAGGLRQFVSIVLPLIFSSISSYIIICVAQVAVNQLSAYSFWPNAGAKNLDCQSIGYMLFQSVADGEQDAYPIAAAGGVLFTLIVAPVTLIIRWLLEKFGPSAE